MMHAEVPQRVDDRVGDCRRSANGAALSGTFDAKRVVSSWGFLEIKCERRQHIRPRHRVVHIGPGKELARFRIVGAVLEESLADSLCDGAVHLPFNHHRIDYSPGVVDSIKLPHTDMAGISVDHDDTKVNCRWCIAPFRVKKHLLLKSVLDG